MSKTSHSIKGEQSRLNVLYIIFTLKRYSNEDHPLSVTEITRKINQDFLHLTTADQIISSDTVKRTLDTLLDYLFDPCKLSLTDDSLDYGFTIFCVMKTEKGFETYHPGKDGKRPQKYYYYQSSFTNAEVTTLMDAVETYNYFSDDDIMELINKLIRLQPISYAADTYSYYDPTPKDENSLLIPNIDLLDKIIDNKKCARITYCSYNHSKELVPRKGYPKVIEPLALMWSNGYYYLVAYHPDHKSVVHFRIDRITDIEPMDQTPMHPLKDFNASRYRLEHPVMYGGSRQEMVFLCRQTPHNYIMNTIMDTFGKPARIVQASDQELLEYLGHDSAYYKEKNETWFRVSVYSTPGGVELWASQYCADCRLIYPSESADRVKEALNRALQYYQ